MSTDNENIPSLDKTPAKYSHIVKYVKRFLVFLSLLVLLIVSAGFIIGIFYRDEVKAYVIQQLNKQLNTEVIVDPSDIQFSVIKNFPAASIEFKNVTALDAIAQKDKKDTLFRAGSVSLQFNIIDVFRKNYKIRKLSLSDITLKVKIDKNGNDNYHFWKALEGSKSDRLTFVLDKVQVSNVNIQYDDKKSKQYYSLVINKGVLSGKLDEEEYDLKTDIQLHLGKIVIDSTTYIENKSAELKAYFFINNKTHTYTVHDGKIKLADMNFLLGGTTVYVDNTATLDLLLKGKDLDIKSFLSLLPEKYKNKTDAYSSAGDFYFETTIKGNYNTTETPIVEANFGIRNGSMKHDKSDLGLQQIQLVGTYSSQNNSKLNVEEFSGKFSRGSINGRFSIQNFSDPLVNLKLNASLDLYNFQQFMEIDTIESLAGNATIDILYRGHLPKGEKGNYFSGNDLANAKTSGSMELRNVSARLKNSKHKFDSINGSFLFDNSDIIVNDLQGAISGSDFALKGFFRNILPYIFIDKEELTVDAKLKCKMLNLNNFLVDEDKTTVRDTVYELRFSEYIHLNLISEIKELHFRQFKANAIKGRLTLEQKRMMIDPVTFNTMDGQVKGSMVIDGTAKNKISISCSANLEKVNINKLFIELENFGQKTFTDKNIKGFLTADIQYTSEWTPKLVSKLDKVYATADIKIEKGELLKFEPLKAFSKFINVSDLENIKFSTLENQIEIKNQTIFIPKMEFKNNALNLICSGKHSFNNEIDYHIQLLMRELLAKKVSTAKKENEEFGEVEDDGLSRSLFISMTGTVEHPIIKYDKRGMFQKVKDDIKKAKETLKTILNEEFGWFKKDSTRTKNHKKEEKKEDKKFKVKWGDSDKEDQQEDEDF